jgi:hypothetical protein
MKSLGTHYTFDEIFRRFAEGCKRMAYLRYCDGQWVIFDDQPESAHRFSPELKEELKKAFQVVHRDYLVANVNYDNEPMMEKGVFAQSPNVRYDQILAEIEPKEREYYYNPIAFHYLSLLEPEKVVEFFRKFIVPKKVLVVGGAHIRPAAEMMRANYFAEVPAKDAFDHIDEFWPDVLEKANKVEVVIFACGMCTTVMQKRLWDEGIEVVSLDLGSLLDMFLGLSTRQWINKNREKVIKFNEIWNQNIA